MGYESYEPYEQYDPYEQGQGPDGPGQGGHGQGGGQGGQGQEQQPYYQEQYREPYQEPYPGQYQEQPEQYRQPYPEGYGEQYPPGQYQEPQYQEPQHQEQRYPQPQPQYQDAQWAQSGMGWEQQAWDEARLGVSPLQEAEYPQQEQDYGYDYPQGEYPARRHAQPERYAGEEQYPREQAGEAPAAAYPSRYEEQAELPRQRAQGQESAQAGFAGAPATVGRGAFGAAGIGVLAAIAALAASGALLVVVALVQAGVAYGWQQATAPRQNGRADRRVTILTALIGWAAAASAFRLPANDDFVGLPVTLGVGFLLLAADQTLRARPFGAGERVAGLGVAVTGGLFAVLPAGFVVAERSDTALTAACALAAALGVLCCALLGRNPVRGILAGLLLGAGIGAVAAQSLTANGGLKAGALGGAVAALGAATALGALDRIVAEGEARGSTRIVSQVLPFALAAMGALFASAVFR